MARPPNFYVVKFRNPKVDPHDHFMVLMVPAATTLERGITMLRVGRPQLELDFDPNAKAYSSYPEAEAESNRLGEVSQALNPDRVPATEQFPPGEANRILEVGNPVPGDQEQTLPGTIGG